MAQETGTAAGAGSGAKDQRQRDHIDEDEVSELQKSRSFYDRVREQAERFASTRIGQFVIERADKALVMIEDTAKWSLPQEKSATPLERPLPWGPFLMLIILLRLTRIWLSVGALMIGNGPISPSDMVYFIQTRRRKLRAIRVHGLKVMRQRQQEISYGSSSSSSASGGQGLSQKLTQWLSKAMCRPGVQRANSGRLFVVRNSEQTTQTSPAVMKRPREEDTNAEADHNLTIDQMLAKYANENSEDDSDFVPNLEEEDTSGSSSNSSDESSDEISSGEAEEVLSQAKPKPMENGVHKAADKENDKEKEKDKGKGHLTTSSNGDNNREQASAAAAAEVGGAAHKLKLEDQQKSSPGHVSAAMMSTRTYNSTAAAGSPTCFNTSLGTQSLLKNASIQSVLAHSTPTAAMEDQPTDSPVPETQPEELPSPLETEKPLHPQNQKQHQNHQQQRNHSHQRFRGRNRR